MHTEPAGRRRYPVRLRLRARSDSFRYPDANLRESSVYRFRSHVTPWYKDDSGLGGTTGKRWAAETLGGAAVFKILV